METYSLPFFILFIALALVFIPQLPDFFHNQLNTQMIYITLTAVVVGTLLWGVFRVR